MITVKQGDRVPVALTVNHNLGAASVVLAVKHLSRSALAETVDVDVTDAAAGEVGFMLDGTWARGDHYLELKITQGEELRTAPSEGTFVVRVVPAIIPPPTE